MLAWVILSVAAVELARPTLVFGRSRAGIDWDAPDGEPVHLVFLLLTPLAAEHGLQLQILAGLAHGLNQESARKRLMQATSEGELWTALEAALQSQKIARVTAEGTSLKYAANVRSASASLERRQPSHGLPQNQPVDVVRALVRVDRLQVGHVPHGVVLDQDAVGAQ